MKKEDIDLQDLSWLMPSIDPELLMDRLGIKVHEKTQSKNGDELIAFCPDHRFYTGRDPSHPKWSFNISTGYTKCWTEERGSNILWTIARIRGCSWEEALKWMVGKELEDDLEQIKMNHLKKVIRSLNEKENQKESRRNKNLDDIEEQIKNEVIYETGLNYFMFPPGKPPTKIRKETVSHFKVVERKWGYYTNRVIIPFYQKEEFVGFAALDILGEKEWLRRHPGLVKKDYRKVLYLSSKKGFSKESTLFGYDEIEKGSLTVVITEGPREVMKLWQEGFDSVAILSTDMSSTQIRLLSELAPKKVVIMLDGDDKGRESSKKIYGKLFRLFDVWVSFLPEGVDPKQLGRRDLFDTIKKIKKI